MRPQVFRVTLYAVELNGIPFQVFAADIDAAARCAQVHLASLAGFRRIGKPIVLYRKEP